MGVQKHLILETRREFVKGKVVLTALGVHIR